MPKSRGRARKQPRPGRSVGSRTEVPAEIRLVQAADALEAAGDVTGALDLMRRHPCDSDGQLFWRPERLRRLVQIEELGPVLPRWAMSRWALAQALQVLDPAGLPAARRALDIAVETRGGPSTLYGVDSADAHCKVVDHDWVFRQVLLYELGALARFLARTAAAPLVAAADRIHDWARAPMGGYRFVGATPLTVACEDLATGEVEQVLNLGCCCLVEEGECAIGRLVPVTEGRMFETAPLPVPAAVAQAVADDPAGWVAVLRQACRVADSGILTWCIGDFPLLTDVPDGIWLLAARAIAGLDGPPTGPAEALGSAADAVRLGLEVVDGAADVPAPGLWPCIAAALVEPGVVDLVRVLLDPDDAAALTLLARRLHAPASEICRSLADELC